MPSCRNLVIARNACGGEKGRCSLSAPISATNHVHSSSFKGLGVESLAEFGVNARMGNSLLGKAGYLSFQNPAF